MWSGNDDIEMWVGDLLSNRTVDGLNVSEIVNLLTSSFNVTDLVVLAVNRPQDLLEQLRTVFGENRGLVADILLSNLVARANPPSPTSPQTTGKIDGHSWSH